MYFLLTFLMFFILNVFPMPLEIKKKKKKKKKPEFCVRFSLEPRS